MLNSNDKNISKKKFNSQYYTKSSLSSVLVGMLPENMLINKVIDISAGEGALLTSCRNKYPDCELYGFDIDHKNIDFLRKQNINATLLDSTTDEIDVLPSSNIRYCLSVGNPPFKNIDVNEHIKSLFSAYGIKIKNKIRAENYFLLYSLHITKKSGMTIFIVPDGIINGDKNKKFRSILAEQFNIIEVMEIPTGFFHGTEATTFIISIKKIKKTSEIKLSFIYNSESSMDLI